MLNKPSRVGHRRKSRKFNGKLCPFCGKTDPSTEHFRRIHQTDPSEAFEVNLDAVAGYSFHLMIPSLLD